MNDWAFEILKHPVHERSNLVSELDSRRRRLYFELAREAELIIKNITTNNDALLYSGNENPFVRYHCGKLLNTGKGLFD